MSIRNFLRTTLAASSLLAVAASCGEDHRNADFCSSVCACSPNGEAEACTAACTADLNAREEASDELAVSDECLTCVLSNSCLTLANSCETVCEDVSDDSVTEPQPEPEPEPFPGDQ